MQFCEAWPSVWTRVELLAFLLCTHWGWVIVTRGKLDKSVCLWGRWGTGEGEIYILLETPTFGGRVKVKAQYKLWTFINSLHCHQHHCHIHFHLQVELDMLSSSPSIIIAIVILIFITTTIVIWILWKWRSWLENRLVFRGRAAPITSGITRQILRYRQYHRHHCDGCCHRHHQHPTILTISLSSLSSSSSFSLSASILWYRQCQCFQ